MEVAAWEVEGQGTRSASSVGSREAKLLRDQDMSVKVFLLFTMDSCKPADFRNARWAIASQQSQRTTFHR
jgi:hypothetical protein